MSADSARQKEILYGNEFSNRFEWDGSAFVLSQEGSEEEEDKICASQTEGRVLSQLLT
jgi:hypothetical protein